MFQETLLAELKAKDRFAGRSSERSWLAGILKNKILDHYRKMGRETCFPIYEFFAEEGSDLLKAALAKAIGSRTKARANGTPQRKP